MGCIFVPLGVIFLVTSNKVVEVSARYDNKPECAASTSGTSNCFVELDVPKDMKKPVFLYYSLHNFYQNHRRYVKSRSDVQLRTGKNDLPSKDTVDCDPLRYIPGTEIVKPYCGLIAASVFTDVLSPLKDPQGADIALRDKGIAWKSDVEKKFAPGTSEDLIVWMRTAGLPNFKKLYRIIDTDLTAGKYNLTINSTYDVASFSGKKFVVLSTTEWLGGKNNFLGLAYIVVGSICFFLAAVFAIKNAISPRKIGDQQWLFKAHNKSRAN